MLSFKGWNSHVHRGLPGNLESTNLSRDILSMGIGRTHTLTTVSSQIKNLDFGGVDSSRLSILRGGIPGPTGDPLEVQTLRFLRCRISVCGLTVAGCMAARLPGCPGCTAPLQCQQLVFISVATVVYTSRFVRVILAQGPC